MERRRHAASEANESLQTVKAYILTGSNLSNVNAEDAISRLRAELQQAQSQLSEAVEGRVATEAASRASSDELQRVHAELKVLQLRVGQ